jgi:hypothetical protein
MRLQFETIARCGDLIKRGERETNHVIDEADAKRRASGGDVVAPLPALRSFIFIIANPRVVAFAAKAEMIS